MDIWIKAHVIGLVEEVVRWVKDIVSTNVVEFLCVCGLNVW
jgi:hypothetical protein